MPRQLLQRRYWERVRERKNRLAPGTSQYWHLGGKIPFIDYWMDIPATLPEKMIFAELHRRQINFKFAYYLGDLKVTPGIRERYRPDFLLTDYNVIIEVAGVYWHSRPGMYEHDAVRTALLTAEGYKVYVITDQDLYHRGAAAVLADIPEVAGATIHGGEIIIGERPVDPRASIRSRLKRWPRINQVSWKDSVPGSPGVLQSYSTQKKPIRPIVPPGPVFTTLSEDLLNWAGSLKRSTELLTLFGNLMTDYWDLLQRDRFTQDIIKRIVNKITEAIDAIVELQMLGIYEDWAKEVYGDLTSLRSHWRQYL